MAWRARWWTAATCLPPMRLARRLSSGRAGARGRRCWRRASAASTRTPPRTTRLAIERRRTSRRRLRSTPIPKFERWLVERGWLTAESAERIRAEYEADSAEAADWAEQEPDPRPEDIGKNVYEG